MSTTTAKPLKMSDTALKFGPEWLRALSHGDTAVSPPPSPSLGAPRYKLAQHRYGREEMLALYDKMMKAPDDLATAPPLYIEKTQTPLALIQMSDEEMRMWQRGVNSDVVLKQMGRTAGPSVGGAGPSVGAGPARGRGGGSMDRGRGRARGIGSAVGAYNRGTSYEDEGGDHGRREGPPTGFGRGARPFERSQSSSERVWIERPERNGTEAEWNGSTSPRKEFGAVRPAAGDNNWRSREAMKERERAENKEEEDGWRTAGRGERWGRTGWRSEREGGERDPGSGEKRDPWVEGSGGANPGERSERHRAWEEDGRPTGASYYSNNRGRGGNNPNRRGWDENDSLPEWVAEDLQGGGTFDSSGAFRDERWSDEDDGEGKKRRVLRKRVDPSQEGNADDGGGAGDLPTQAIDIKEPPAEEASPAIQVASVPAVVPVAAAVNASPVHPRGPSPESSQPVRVDEDGLEHAQAVVSTLVAQLVEDEDQPKSSPSPPNPNMGMDQWFYRDPQGEVQGPFTSAEMTEWFNSGYFTMALSVRRACDERYAQLGELTKMWGRLPFMPGPLIPPMKNSDLHPMAAEQEKLQMIQQQLIQQQMFQQQMMQQQHMLRQQSIIAKLSQMEGWNTLSPIQQQQVVNQHMANMPLPGDPLLQQLRLQMEAQAKLQAEMLLQQRKDPVHSLVNHLQHQPQPVLEQQQSASMKHDPIQVFLQQLLGQPKASPAVSKPPSNVPNNKPQEIMDPIQSLIQQAQWNANVAAQGGVMDPSGNHVAPGFHGLPPGAGLVPWPPHTHSIGMPTSSTLFQAGPGEPPITSVWDLENAKVEEAKRQMEHQQQMAEMHRREMEEKRMKEEEDERRRREIQEREEERMRIEEMRRETERQQQAEEMRRRELQQQQQQQQHQQQQQQLQMEEKRRREEEKRKREEEIKQQQAEEERIRREEERIRKEEERVAEQQRRQQEALQRLQEQQAVAAAQARAAQLAAQQQQQQQQQAQAQAQAKAAQAMMAPWAQQQQQQQQQQHTGESLSMAEIQKLQEEKEAKERAIAQAQKVEQAARAAALLQQQQQQAAIKLRWAKQNTTSAANAKSLAEIQAEEAAQLARQKEKEAKEKANQQVNLNLAAASAWGSSHHSNSAWSSGRTAAAVVGQQQPPPPPATANHSNVNTSNTWKAGSVGFWEDPTPPPPKQQAAAKTAPQQQATKAAPKPTAAAAAAAAKPAAAANANAKPAVSQTAAATTAAANTKNRNNKEEEAVRKLFNQTATTEKKDSFSQWCFEYLKKVQAQIDVPTFVAFLKDVESPFEVQEYVRLYLGEGKDAKEFAKQFLDQRSRWRQMQRNVQQYEEDNMCIPAKAINPGQSSDFHEVKSKSKKSKKKMQKVDASLLGFSVSASTDRINVGERDFVDGM